MEPPLTRWNRWAKQTRGVKERGVRLVDLPGASPRLGGFAMTILDKLERRFGRYAIPHLTFSLMLGQIFVYFFILIEQLDPARMVLVPALVLEGELWRLVTFLFMPPFVMHPIFLAFVWYIFYLMGSSLEQHWGNFKFNIFLGIAWVATIVFSFFAPEHPAINRYIMGSVFLAFAFLNPNFELMLFLLLPIKVKWLAAITWGFYGLTLLLGPMGARMGVLAAVLNFSVFFGRDIVQVARARQRRKAFEAQRAADAEEPMHRCHICGRTDLSDPDLTFRYCSKCAGHLCYCEEHLRNHEHVGEGAEEEEI